MGNLSKFALSAGLGAAQVYFAQKNRAASEARIAALARGEKPPVEDNPLDGVVDKVKSLFASDKPVNQSVVTPVPGVTAIEPVALAPLQAEPMASEVSTGTLLVPEPSRSPETVAFNDDAAVPSTPTAFQNSYN